MGNIFAVIYCESFQNVTPKNDPRRFKKTLLQYTTVVSEKKTDSHEKRSDTPAQLTKQKGSRTSWAAGPSGFAFGSLSSRFLYPLNSASWLNTFHPAQEQNQIVKQNKPSQYTRVGHTNIYFSRQLSR